MRKPEGTVRATSSCSTSKLSPGATHERCPIKPPDLVHAALSWHLGHPRSHMAPSEAQPLRDAAAGVVQHVMVNLYPLDAGEFEGLACQRGDRRSRQTASCVRRGEPVAGVQPGAVGQANKAAASYDHALRCDGVLIRTARYPGSFAASGELFGPFKAVPRHPGHPRTQMIKCIVHQSVQLISI